jgi:hypothetical protein
MTIVLFLMVLLVLSVLGSYVLFESSSRGRPPWLAICSAASVFVFLPGIAHAADNSGGGPGDGVWQWIVGGVVSTLGGIFGMNAWKERARQLEMKVIAAAENAARAVGVGVQKKLVEGVHAFKRWDGLFEGWAMKEVGKLPDPLRGLATAAAHKVFQELHLYADQAGHEAVKQLEDAVGSFSDRLREFEAAWPSISAEADKLAAQVKKLPLAPAPLKPPPTPTTASGEVGK